MPTPQTPPSPDPLSQLQDIILPQAVSTYPALGWWLLAMISIILLIVIIKMLINKQQRGAGKRFALKQLQQLNLNFQQSRDKQALLIKLSQLLKQAALIHSPRQQVAGLQGEDWLRFLDKQAQTPLFNQGIGRRLTQAPYQAKTDLNEDDCKQLLYLSQA